MSFYGITSDQASTLFSSLNSSLSSSTSSMYDIAASFNTFKIEAKYYAKEYSSKSNSTSTSKLNGAEKAEIKQEGYDLKAAIASLTTKGTESVFNQYIGKADDEEAIKSATIKNGSSVQPKDIKLDIKQLAEAQQNVGNQLVSKDKDLENGNYSFNIGIGSKTHTINFKVESNDNNLSIQKKIAAAINDKDIGITAKANTVDDKSYLSIVSNETGKTSSGSDIIFNISSSTGSVSQSVIDKFGLDNVTKKAQNAIYSVNDGDNVESRSNNVKLSNGAEVEFAKVTNGNVNISFEADRTSVNNSIKNFVSSFNSILSGAASDKLSDALSTLSKSHKSSLAKIGLNVSSTGQISIDEDKLGKAGITQIKNVFSDSYSFGGSVNRKAGEMISSPQRFLDNVSSASGLYNSSASLYNQYNDNILNYLL